MFGKGIRASVLPPFRVCSIKSYGKSMGTASLMFTVINDPNSFTQVSQRLPAVSVTRLTDA